MAWHELLSLSSLSHAIFQINHVIDLIGSGIMRPPPCFGFFSLFFLCGFMQEYEQSTELFGFMGHKI